MKKNYTMRAATLLLVLTLITSCFVGGTFAKYTTKIAGSDTARVAKFGVELTADAEIFSKSYNGDNSISVLSDGTGEVKDVIAPGTTGTATTFTISGDPEVDVNVIITLSGDPTTTADDLKMATLPAGTGYIDYTEKHLKDGKTNEYEYHTFKLDDNYYPVQWTLSYRELDSTSAFAPISPAVTDATLAEIETYLASMSKLYNVENGDAESNSFAAINGEYQLTWNWYFDEATDAGKGTNDKADTFMGNVAAGVATAPAGYVGTETFNFYMLVEQVN